MIHAVFDRLEKIGEKNTIAFFLSDNGFMWNEHQLYSKGYAYNPSIKIPLFVRWPGSLPFGATDRRVTGPLDIAPTLYDVTDINPSYVVDGRSLLESRRRKRILIEYESFNPNTASFRGVWAPSWSYIEVGTGEREFYGRDDPWQLENLLGNADASDDPETAALERWLDKASSCSGRDCP